MRIAILIFLCLSAALFVPQARAEAIVYPDDNDSLKMTVPGKIDQIVDGTTILLKDGKIVALSGLYLPSEESGPAAKTALAELLPEGTDVLLYQTRDAKEGRLNRMGHHLAHPVLKGGNVWVQGELIARGLAAVLPDERAPELASEMYALEQKARLAQAGFWKTYAVLTADTAAQGLERTAIVEGTVRKTATVKNNVYLNFGDDWKTDFTVMIAPAVRKELARGGIDPLALDGRTIRARGWVRDYNGPFLDLTHPSRLEILQPAPETPTLAPNP